MNRIVIGIFIGTPILYAILSFTYATNGYPCFFQDALCFLPTSYFINHHHQLINPLYDAGIDAITHKFLFYPPLFPYVVALICKLLPDNYTQIRTALTLIDISSIIVILRSAYVYIKKYNINYNFYLYLLLAVWTFALFSFHGVFDGRPEILANFFIACFILNNLYNEKRFFNYINGILIGLNAINSPISTFYLIIITIGVLFYSNSFKIKPIIQTVTGFTIVFGCFTLLYPYQLTDLLHGLLKHSTNVVVNRAKTGSDRLKWIRDIYFISQFHPIAALSFLISIFFTLNLLIKQKKVLSVLCFILLFASIYFFAFKNVLMAYNMFVLSSIYMFVLLIILINILNKQTHTNVLNKSFWVLIILLFVNSLGLFRTAVVFFSTQDKKVPLANLGKEIDFLSKKLRKDKKIYVTFSLWEPSLNKVNSVISYTPMDNPVVQFIIFQQSNSGLNNAPEISGFKLIKNGFIPDHPMIGRFKIGNTYPWYQTAIYERN
ncbi:MAG: hypothetical protein ACRYFA_03085 [Janthinobacterium lividum]